MTVHRYWTGPEPAPLGRWGRQTVVTVHPGASVVDWTDDTLPTAALLDHPSPRARSNHTRFWLLHRHGGLWLDHDVVPLRDLTGATRPWVASLSGRAEATVMWFPTPGHPLPEAMAAAVAADPDSPAVAHLAGLIGHHRDVTLNPRVLPHDSTGRRLPTSEVWAVHLWATSHLPHEATR